MEVDLVKSHHRLVHLDLKGAPPRVNIYSKLFPLFKEWGATGLLIEYEDMFPYTDNLDVISCSDSYSFEDIATIKHLAFENNLTIIPLVQSYGHFEFVLKHERFKHIREVPLYPMALCPSNPEAISVVTNMIDQVMKLHPETKWFHIGADEVYHIGCCEKCIGKNDSKQNIFIQHVKSIASYVKSKYPNVLPIIWEDMFRSVELSLLEESEIGKYVEPMIWDYSTTLAMLPRDIWKKYATIFDNVWFASAFKGATGASMFVTDVNFHIGNQLAWINLLNADGKNFKNFRGFAITGWQRYDHFAILCEVLPVAIPSLALCLQVLLHGEFTKEIHEALSEKLGFKHLIPWNSFERLKANSDQSLEVCDFPGCKIYQLLHYLLCMNSKYDALLKNERICGWATTYHFKHNYGNPVHLEYCIEIVASLLNEYEKLNSELRIAFDDFFYKSTGDEWLAVNLAPKIKNMSELVNDMKKVYEVGAKPKDSL